MKSDFVYENNGRIKLDTKPPANPDKPTLDVNDRADDDKDSTASDDITDALICLEWIKHSQEHLASVGNNRTRELSSRAVGATFMESFQEQREKNTSGSHSKRAKFADEKEDEFKLEGINETLTDISKLVKMKLSMLVMGKFEDYKRKNRILSQRLKETKNNAERARVGLCSVQRDLERTGQCTQ
jgi:hypothetical protein